MDDELMQSLLLSFGSRDAAGCRGVPLVQVGAIGRNEEAPISCRSANENERDPM